MELVLGLAALATAISSVGGANHVDSSPEIVEAEPKTVQTMNENAIQEVNELPESHVGSLKEASLEIAPRGRPIDNWEHYQNESESNNAFFSANDVGIYNYDYSTYQAGDTPTSYWKSIKGCIGEEGDEDYYKFTLYGKANVTITLGDIPDQCDYDLRLYEQGTGLFGEAQCQNQIHYCGNSSNNSETLTKTLYPNTYYIKVYSWRGYGSPLYSLGLTVSYIRNNESITAMKEKGAKGALWLSDYDPYGIQPSITDSRVLVGSTGSWSRCVHYPRDWEFGSWSTSHFTFPIDTGEYKHAEIYIWDESFRQQMLSLVTRLYDAISAEITREVEFRLSKQVQNYWWGVGITILGYVPYIGTAVSLISDAYDLISGAADILCPSEDILVTKGNYLEYLSRMEAALDMYRPLPGSDITAFKIPMRYKIIKKTNESAPSGSGVPSGASYNCTNYYLTYQPSDPRQYFGYYEDTIYAQDAENPITGTIYPIVDGNSMHMALARETYNMSFATISNNSDRNVSINRGEYTWYKFTAPQNGTYYFMSKGDEETTIDIFDNMVYGKSDYGRVSRYYKNNGVSTGVNFSLSLGEGQTIYLRVSGGNGAYSALSSTTLKISNTRFPSVFARINAWDLEVPMNLDNPFFFNFISVGNQYNLYVSSVGAFYNTERGAIELLCDRDNNKPFAFLIMLFDRPIKQINFGNAVGNSYSYAHLGLYLQGLNQYGFPVTEDVADNYGNSYLLPCNVRYDDRDEAIYGVMFRIDPETDTSPYHVGYQESLIGDFVVEFNDY